MTDIEKLNRFTRRELTPEEVYLFDVILCDNDIDRDLECFSDSALHQLQPLFIGKTGISDHDPKACSQTARIYDTEVTADAGRRTRDGRPYLALRAKAYMVRTTSNADLIREIEGGIRKEVSVSCSAAQKHCSVCGSPKGGCSHIPGRTYADKTCHIILDQITDAYEWSFVAVPAQPAAGVTKHCTGKECASMEENEIIRQAESAFREDVLQLCSRRFSGCVCKAVQTAAQKMTIPELIAFRTELAEEPLSAADVQLAAEPETTDGFLFR